LFRFRTSELVNLFGHLVGFLGRWISPTQGFYLHSTTRHRKRGHTSILRAGFKPAIPLFERPKRVCASDRAATDRLDKSYYSKMFLVTSILCSTFVQKSVLTLKEETCHISDCMRQYITYWNLLSPVCSESYVRSYAKLCKRR